MMPTKLHISLSDHHISGGRLEHAVAYAFEQHKEKHQLQNVDVTFDFADSIIIEPYAHQLLISYICRFDQLGWNTRIILPKKRETRDYMRAWGVQFGFLAATGRKLYDYCTEHDRNMYFTENERQISLDLSVFPKGTPQPYSNTSTIGNLFKTNNYVNQPRSYNAYAFHTFDVAHCSSPISISNQEKRYWQSENIVRLLEDSFDLDTSHFSPRIVFEAMLNSLRHPGADIVQTAAYPQGFDGKYRDMTNYKLPSFKVKRQSPGTHFKIHYWDNGRSMLDVFSEGIQRLGNNARLMRDDDFETNYRIKIEHFESKKRTPFRTINSNMDLDGMIDDIDLLIAMTFPYVSSAHDSMNHAVAEETSAFDQRFSATGMGLYLLVDAATKIFNGTLNIRTGKYVVQFKKNKLSEKRADKVRYGHDYNVKITIFDEMVPSFYGNAISVQIPIS